MDFGLASYGLSFVAGSLSTLSPCVLPILPILLGTAVLAHRLGPYVLAGGLALSFTVVGVLIASLGSSIGLDQTMLRYGAALLLLVFGLVLVSPVLQERFAGATSGLSGTGQTLLARVTLDGLPGQFMLGLLLGIVWSPCVGPTLGAAISLASQGRSLGQVTLLMGLFGLGAGVPLVVLGLLSRQAMTRIRGQLLSAGRVGKQLLGGIMLLLGGLILSGADKAFEAWVVELAPDWLISLTTSI
ncbi:cytochrome c biogenesis CcdA family protein [Denitratisoma oestradiolicum]|uniref:Cytochrome C biogenesis protein n=1 Tax=Denitratisoma oestradiolicum TaxID=311182 RepID=A0A6S6XZP4_9PROT|nr:cytochrome c biogenesis CcdA family protein [Denitratisoma oestradiolicum]TWO79648.1 cytochrome C biogenesis protein [Denitratisoma oestradiolicum]CAB1370453.1 Cytochrome C biogenesis protein [Denitratisoma oestradiolicum]